MAKNSKGSRVTAKGTRPANYRPHLGNIAHRASQIQAQVAAAREAASNTEVVGTAGGGAVKLTVRCNQETSPVSIEIADELIGDADMLSDVIIEAIRDANRKAAAVRTSAAEDEVGEGLDLDALGLGGLLG